VRGTKVKKLRRLYRQWVDTFLKEIPEGYEPISFRVFRKRVREGTEVYRLR
jgi:hypothetical protein